MMDRAAGIPGIGLTLAALLAGCAQTKPPLYHWGAYESLIYDMYEHPGKAEPGEQITRLTQDIEQTHAEGKRVPPGVHAHLGYMYYVQGNESAALEEFATERELFPESATFVDGMIGRIRKDQQ